MPAYDPTARDTSNKRPASIGAEDIVKKKNALFGLSNSALSKPQSQQSELQTPQSSQKPVQRPQSMESKPMTLDIDDEIGEINLGFSRRKGKSTGAKDRPATSSAHESKPSFGSKNEDEVHHVEEEGEEAESEYLSAVLSRGDKKDKKPAAMLGGIKPGETMKSSFGKLSLPTETVKSPTSELVISKEGFNSIKESGFPQLGGDEKRESVKSPVGILGKKELQEPHGQTTLQGKSVASIVSHGVRKEKADGFGSRYENLQGSGLSGTGGWDGSIRDMVASTEVVQAKDALTYGHLKETEEYYKRRTKETEEYYENRYKRLKEAIEEEKAKWEEIHEKELKLLRKENEDLRENMNRHLERERERMREMMSLEIESKEKIHRYELQRQRRMFEEENDSLKKQFEAQTKLNNLADEIKTSSKKLISISDKIEVGGGSLAHGPRGELRDREKQVEELERKLKHELEMVNDEKKRLDRIRLELESRDNLEKQSLEKERELLRQEYNRLNDLQDSIKKQETDKARSLEKERMMYEVERVKLEKEEMTLKEEYNTKYHELEVQAEVVEMRKREFEKVLDKTEAKFLLQKEELERTTKRLAAIEMDLVARVKELEYKEMQVSKGAEEVQKRMDLLELERITFEKERGQILKMADATRKENAAFRKFRQDFEAEKEDTMRLKGDLTVFAANLRKERNKISEEKSNINMLQKTLEGLKHDYVKEITLGQQKPVEITAQSMYPIETSQETSPTKQSYVYKSPRSPSWGYTSKAYTDKENVVVNSVTSPQAVPMNSDRYVRLKDLRKDVNNGRHERKITPIIVVEEPRIIYEDSVKSSTKKERKFEDPDDWMKNITPKGIPVLGDTFNYRSYMAELKEFDKVSNKNQGYVVTEEEGLKQTKKEINPLSSPKMYFAGNLSRKLRTMTNMSDF